MTHPLQLLLLLMLIIVAAKAAGAPSNKLGRPAVFGGIAIGLILGPTVLNLINTPLFSPAVSHGGSVEQPSLLAVVVDPADIGVILLMFVAVFFVSIGLRANGRDLGGRLGSRCRLWPWPSRPRWSAVPSVPEGWGSTRLSRSGLVWTWCRGER